MAEFTLGRYNVIIGPQSSGKSCILKIASYCSWVEKHIEIAQNADDFKGGDSFIRRLASYHRLAGYVKENSYISFETRQMRFSYDKEHGFCFAWKDRWSYRRPKISYIPAERNLLSAVPNWMDISMNENSISDFMSDWNNARRSIVDAGILNLGIRYYFDQASNLDFIRTVDDTSLHLSDASSGLQSLIPLLLFLQYAAHNIFSEEKSESFKGRNKNDELPYIIYRMLAGRKGEYPGLIAFVDDEPVTKLAEVPSVFRAVGKSTFGFSNEEDADRVSNIYKNLVLTQRCDTFIEEPEMNLFPPTQKQLVDWIIDNGKRTTFTIATHSPYILTAFLEKKDLKDFHLMYIPTVGEQSVLQIATAETIQNIFDYGVDAFFNIESL